jgi:hypothetical protein
MVMSKPDFYTANIEALKALKTDSVTAWMSPGGIVHIVPLFNHLDFFIRQPDALPEATSFLNRFKDALGELSLSRQHMAEAMNLVYAAGWGRIGTFGGNKIELDCASEHMKDLRRSTKALARVLNRALVCNVPPPFQKPARKRPPLARDEVWSSLRPGFSGWLSPDGIMHETPPDAPFATFTDDPDRLPEAAKAFEDAVAEDQQRQRHEFTEFAIEEDPDGHIGWHRFYESPYSPDVLERPEMTSMVLAYGWGHLRVEEARIVILEASPDALPRLRELLERSVSPAGCEVDAREWNTAAEELPSP